MNPPQCILKNEFTLAKMTDNTAFVPLTATITSTAADWTFDKNVVGSGFFRLRVQTYSVTPIVGYKTVSYAVCVQNTTRPTM